jgi:hypothetical protein
MSARGEVTISTGSMVMGIKIRNANPSDAEALRGVHHLGSYIWTEDHRHLDAHPEVFGVDPEALASGHVRNAHDAEGTVLGFATVRPIGNPRG